MEETTSLVSFLGVQTKPPETLDHFGRKQTCDLNYHVLLPFWGLVLQNLIGIARYNYQSNKINNLTTVGRVQVFHVVNIACLLMDAHIQTSLNVRRVAGIV